MSSEKTLSWEEVQEGGLLLEVNRLFFHPRGLKLEVNLHGVGDRPTAKIIELLDDDEGYVFDGFTQQDLDRSNALREEVERKMSVRDNALGFVVQPIEVTPVAKA